MAVLPPADPTLAPFESMDLTVTPSESSTAEGAHTYLSYIKYDSTIAYLFGPSRELDAVASINDRLEWEGAALKCETGFRVKFLQVFVVHG